MLKKRKFNNPYIEKSNNHPELIINDSGKGLNSTQIAQVQKEIDSYPKRYLEIGSGSGMFLLERAHIDSESLHIGVEIRYKRAVRTIEKGLRRELKNILILRTDANNIEEYFSKNSLDGIFINFPDPWDKKKWLKHRIIREEMLDIFSSILKEDAFLSYKTDHEDYYNYCLELLKNYPKFKISEQTRDLHNSSYSAKNIETEFEKLFKSQNKPIFYLRLDNLGRL